MTLPDRDIFTQRYIERFAEIITYVLKQGRQETGRSHYEQLERIIRERSIQQGNPISEEEARRRIEATIMHIASIFLVGKNAFLAIYSHHLFELIADMAMRDA